jgi:hypothetical protein
MFRPYLATFRQPLTVWNGRTALELNSIYFHAIVLWLFTLKRVCLWTKLSHRSALFSFCGVNVSVMYNIYLLSNANMYYYINLYFCMSVCYFLMYLLASFVCMFSLAGRMSLVWAFSVIVSAYIRFWVCLCIYLSQSSCKVWNIGLYVSFIRKLLLLIL